MGVEIERKFLVKTMGCLDDAAHVNRIRQGYLCLDIDRTVRIRMYNHTGAWITVKGRNRGIMRKEYEYRIPEQDGEEMLEMCEGFIDKTRYHIPYNDLVIEVDVFSGDNLGLVVAEIEFSEDDDRSGMATALLRKELPSWIGDEVSNKTKYYNSSLLANPYMSWK